MCSVVFELISLKAKLETSPKFTVSQLQFISPYNGNKVTATLGSSANFTWVFSGENVKLVQWGTKKNGALSFQNVLVSIDKLTTVTTITNSPYSGRVSAVWNGSSPGLVTFTLDSIQMADERWYICRLEPDRLDVASVYDTVQLLVLAVTVFSSFLSGLYTSEGGHGNKNREDHNCIPYHKENLEITCILSEDKLRIITTYVKSVLLPACEIRIATKAANNKIRQSLSSAYSPNSIAGKTEKSLKDVYGSPKKNKFPPVSQKTEMALARSYAEKAHCQLCDQA
ncbi:hypothetical protein ACROYT_G028471 [Oculina patagonica]